MTLPVPYPLTDPGGNADLTRAWRDLARLLNRPHRSEYTVAIPCEDALALGHGPTASFPTSLYGLSAMDLVPGQVSGAALTAGLTLGNNSIKAIPFMVDHALTVTAMSLHVTTNVANAKARVGIYSSKDDLRGDYNPDQLLVKSDELNLATTGIKTFSCSVGLEPGHVYHAVALSYTAAPVINSLAVGAVHALGHMSGGTALTHVSVAYTLGSTTGLPSVFPTGSVIQSSAIPAIYLTLGPNSSHVATLTRCGAGPATTGHVLKRVRLLKAGGQGRTDSGKPGWKVVAKVAGSGEASAVGTYESRVDALGTNKVRVISDGDIETPIPAGSVFQAEITQYGWPKVSVRDAVVLFDVGVL